MPRPKKSLDDSEPDSKYTTWILAAIAKVKGQKQRPNEERITHVLESTYGVDAQTVVEQLDLCVKAGRIIRGEFKGQSSYKDPSVSTPGSKQRSPQMPSDLRKYVQKAILNEGEDGATVAIIERYFREHYPDKTESMSDLTMAVKHAIQRGVNSGRFIKEGRYVKLSEKVLREPKSGIAQKEILKEKAFSNQAVNKERTKLRPKKGIAQPSPVCGFCLGTAEKNRDGEPEELISCADCGNSGHPSCLKYSPELTEKIQSERWQCIECKICSVCVSAGNADNLLFCDACDKGFHMECLEPPMTDMPSGSWVCFMCTSKPSPRKRKTITTPPRRKIQPISSDDALFATPLSKSSKRKQNSPGLSLLNQDSDITPKRRSGKFSKFSPKSPTQKRPPLPPGVTEEDYALFKRAQEISNNEMSSQPAVVQAPHSRSPPFIQFGPYEITTWYSSPYPQEYARLPKLYLCEFCLKYMKSMTILQRHKTKCGWFHPPANEIYRHEDISVFEVDGAVNKIYCQNLCLLAKLFLDHKTLYYDVEPFLFYVLTLNDRKGCHLVGYFSKEKACQQKYNLSCIMTMPHYQRKGYGRLLIDFSYLLSRIEGQSGSPEKPLSDLGLLTYRSYWKSVILEYFGKHKDSQVTIRDVSRSTGMDPHDVAATLQQLNMAQRKDGKVIICLNRKNINEHMEKVISQKRLELDPERLRWTPLVHATAVITEEKVEKMAEGAPKNKDKEEVLEQNGDVDVVDGMDPGEKSPGVKEPDGEEEEIVAEKETEEQEDGNDGSTSEEEDEIVPPRKRSRKAIDESDSEGLDDEEEEDDDDEKRLDNDHETVDMEEAPKVEDIEDEHSELESAADNPELEKVGEVSEEPKSRSSSTSGPSNDDSDDDDDDDDDDDSSSEDSDDSSSCSSESSSSDSSSSSDEGDEVANEEKNTFPGFSTQPTKDPVLTGVKDPPGELTIQQDKVSEEPSGVFSMPQQEGGFDLEDTPLLQDFLGGDINMSASDVLTADSLLGDVSGNFYGTKKDEQSNDKQAEHNSLGISSDLTV